VALNSLKVLLPSTQLVDDWLVITQYLSKLKSDKEKIKLISTAGTARQKQKPECKLFGSHSGFY
jgi:hypothetical protein